MQPSEGARTAFAYWMAFEAGWRVAVLWKRRLIFWRWFWEREIHGF